MKVRLTGATIVMNIDGNEKLHLPVTSSPYLLTVHGCLDQMEQNVFEVRKGRNPEFFKLFSGSKAIFLLVCLASHTYVHYPITGKKKLTEPLRLKEVALPAYSTFVGRGHLQHGGRGWRSFHTLRYHTHLITPSYELEDAIAFAYWESFAVVKKPATNSDEKQQNRM